MIRHVTALATAVFLLSPQMSSATTLNFLGMANAKEEAVEAPVSINAFQNAFVPIATSAFGFYGKAGDKLADLNPAPFAYLDDNDAGLGVCGKVTGKRQCDPSSDDNIQAGEVLGLVWGKSLKIATLFFRGENHPNDSFDKSDDFAVSFDSGASWTQLGLVNAKIGGVNVNATVKQGDYLLLATGSSKEQFYLSAATVSAVPLPAAAWLLIAGLGGLGALRLRKSA